jgi:acetate kinase
VKVLVINSGSSSIKYQLLAMPEAELLAKGLVQRIGEPEGKVEQQAGGKSVAKTETIADHAVGLQRLIELLTEGEGARRRAVHRLGGDRR